MKKSKGMDSMKPEKKEFSKPYSKAFKHHYNLQEAWNFCSCLGRRRSRSRSPQYDDVPRFRDEKPFFGPKTLDGSIKVKYPSIIDGYSQDDKELSEMDKLGLPTGFSFQQGGGLPEKQKKGDKKTFYCEICLIELNSLDTMKSHVSGVSN